MSLRDRVAEMFDKGELWFIWELPKPAPSESPKEEA